MCHRQYMVFFFFQAEDGIRDLTVTGVQTCALPISLASMASFFASSLTLRSSSAVASGAHTAWTRAVPDGPDSPHISVNSIADRKSTRLNSSHSQISYAVFCLKTKKLTNRLNLDLFT